MIILKTAGFEDYELIDSGNGKKLERFGKYKLIRPDPQAIWKPKNYNLWKEADAICERLTGDKGKWIIKTKISEKWLIKYKDLSFYCKLTTFKHTGVFPEQSIQWDFITEKIKKSDKQPNILNLFGYTGIASLAAAEAGAKVTHVDASFPTIGWARENQKASNLDDKPIRWILDDCLKFCEREIRRGTKYDGIIMDPPIYGHGPKGEKWDFNTSFPKLVEICKQLLSDKPLFIIVNAYAISSSSIMLENVLRDFLKDFGGNFETGELVLEETSGKRMLSTGIFTRWSR